jgi:hypothetical protein
MHAPINNGDDVSEKASADRRMAATFPLIKRTCTRVVQEEVRLFQEKSFSVIEVNWNIPMIFRCRQQRHESRYFEAVVESATDEGIHLWSPAELDSGENRR